MTKCFVNPKGKTEYPTFLRIQYLYGNGVTGCISTPALGQKARRNTAQMNRKRSSGHRDTDSTAGTRGCLLTGKRESARARQSGKER